MALHLANPARAAVLALAMLAAAGPAAAQAPAAQRNQQALDDIVDIYSLLMTFQVDAPAAVLVAVNDGASAIRTFGKDGKGETPDHDAIFRIGSISKVMAGNVMAAMQVAGRLDPQDPVTRFLPDMPNTSFDGTPERLIDLVGQASGLPRELPALPGPEGGSDRRQTTASIADFMATDPLMFAPGSRILYSNLGFQMLGAALGAANDGSSYAEALAQYVTGPRGMTSTTVGLNRDDAPRLLPGHFFDGSELPVEPPGDLVGASGGVFTTASDMETWMRWNLDTAPDPVRDVFHAAHGTRADYASVSLMDESGALDQIGMGWVIMDQTAYRPYTLQKAGAHGGYMAYLALAPEKRAGVFVMITMFDFNRDEVITHLANALVADLTGPMN